jgi:hypothetical protein
MSGWPGLKARVAPLLCTRTRCSVPSATCTSSFAACVRAPTLRVSTAQREKVLVHAGEQSTRQEHNTECEAACTCRGGLQAGVRAHQCCVRQMVCIARSTFGSSPNTAPKASRSLGNQGVVHEGDVGSSLHRFQVQLTLGRRDAQARDTTSIPPGPLIASTAASSASVQT